MFGMKVDKVSEGRDDISVATTGALYVIKKSCSEGEILCYQNLNEKRLVATLHINVPLDRLMVEWKYGENCIIHQEGYLGPDVTIRMNCDSILSVTSGRALQATYTGEIPYEYAVVEHGNFIVADQEGGVGAYPLGMTGMAPPPTSVSFSGKTWRFSLSLASNQRFLTSVFPPRPFDWKKSFKERIVHHYSYGKPYPSDEELEEWSNYGNIMVLHENVWHGKYTRTGKVLKSMRDAYGDASWNSRRYVPRDEVELRRIVESAHQNGMKLLLYMSPYYFIGELEEYMKEISSAIKKYQFDGLYWDGISVDVWKGYQAIRSFREIMGDKTLYVHHPTTVGSLERNPIPCPFIDTYADYTLKAEHIKDVGQKYLRYYVSGYNMGNSVGYLCNYDYPLTQELVDQVLEANIRLPYWVYDLTELKEKEDWRVREELQKSMRELYFPKLDAVEHTKLGYC